MAKNIKKLPAVRFFSKVSKHTGYGQASKNFIITLSDSDIRAKMDIRGASRAIGRPVSSYKGNAGIDIYLHCPPYDKHISKNYKIGYFYWEADKLPRQWRRSIHRLDEIWAPCELVRSACKRIGFKGPIEIVPTPSTFGIPEKNVGIPSLISEEYLVSKDVFKFYSIFQWHERKGFKELLKAYLSEFSKKDRVMLILKVMPLGVGKYNRENIRIDILNLKRRLNLKEYPLIYLIDETLPLEDVYALHKYSDCYVSAHHGEGWGIPIHDAMLAGNHLITTKFGGITEYLDENSAHIIKHTMNKVKNMGWSKLYNDDQNWAYPSISHLKGLMRNVYENSKAHMDKTYSAKKIAESMSTDSVGKIIEDILSNKRFSKFI